VSVLFLDDIILFNLITDNLYSILLVALGTGLALTVYVTVTACNGLDPILSELFPYVFWHLVLFNHLLSMFF